MYTTDYNKIHRHKWVLEYNGRIIYVAGMFNDICRVLGEIRAGLRDSEGNKVYK